MPAKDRQSGLFVLLKNENQVVYWAKLGNNVFFSYAVSHASPSLLASYWRGKCEYSYP